MEKKTGLVGYYNYTVILTYIGMLTGFFGIVQTIRANSAAAILCLMIAGFCDMFDGAIASTDKKRTEAEKCFGIQIDSLSDLVCFGVLPASITCGMNAGSVAVTIISGLYVLCALIRLAYFNVDEQERQKGSEGARKWYLGMPVTMTALFVPLAYSLITLFAPSCPWILGVALLVMAALFVLPIPLKKAGTAEKIVFVLFGVADLVLVIIACSGK